MPMLNSIQTAHSAHCPKWVAVAKACNRSSATIYAWRMGTMRIPDQCRQAFDRALGCAVDWVAYDAELETAGGAERPRQPSRIELPQRDTETPPAAPQQPPHPETPRPPETPPQPRSRGFAGLLSDALSLKDDDV